MALYPRLLHTSTPTSGHINIDYYFAGVKENLADRLLINDLATTLALTSAEQTEAEAMINALQGVEPFPLVDAALRYFQLGQAGATGYTTEAELKALMGIV